MDVIGWLSFMAGCTVFFTSSAVLLSRRFKSPSYNSQVPPGSLGFPVVGETLHFLHHVQVNKPVQFFKDRIRKYGPTFKTHLYGRPTVVVNPPSGHKFLFANHNKLVLTAWPKPMTALIGKESLLCMHGDKAKDIRHILSAFLGLEAVQRYVKRVSDTVQRHMEEMWLVGSEVQSYKLVKLALFKCVFNLFFSLSDKEEEDELLGLFELILRAVIQVPVAIPGTAFYKAKVARGKILAKLDKYIAQKRLELEQQKASPTQDLLSILITAKYEDGSVMTDEEIKHNIIMLVLGGHDTTTSTLVGFIKCIAENPWCYERLFKEHSVIVAAKQPGEQLNMSDLRKMKYTWKAVQESMRMVPPFTGIFRKAVKEFQLDGHTIPKGWQLLWTLYPGNKNPEFFENPEKFDPERFNGTGPPPGTFTPFGGGPRMCPGSEFAKIQILIFVHHLVLKYQWSLVDPNEVVLLVPMASPVKGLRVKLVAV